MSVQKKTELSFDDLNKVAGGSYPDQVYEEFSPELIRYVEDAARKFKAEGKSRDECSLYLAQSRDQMALRNEELNYAGYIDWCNVNNIIDTIYGII